ncbi:DUF788 domain-containing protein [Methanobrevibacter olleyae]|uniref:Energy-converting hydrogenase A subunit I n=1 Tax=Methanobrevibacter olleyae TaxID=294671 RepID=A0A126R0I1_METOL|nr:DUF788 domain-containing protein [Methanobrevibacter olleyae]AMK15459.1 energy-converting hydrogenase A subunit I EhaI [Methanobrevibacter olleyae]SFL56827.1 energy-converting hydrogenase A subunit I [Methanobrevibacter olleyae]
MNKMKIASYIIFAVSLLAILYALIFNPADWIVFAIAIVCIPFLILSFGLLTMSKPIKDEEEERREEPFTGY